MSATMIAICPLYSLRVGPHPHAELTVMLALSFPWPRARIAAGAPFLPYLPRFRGVTWNVTC